MSDTHHNYSILINDHLSIGQYLLINLCFVSADNFAPKGFYKFMSVKKINSIGVIIVSYASSDVIEECLNSLVASQFTNLKIVVCDNASPDNTAEIIKTWAHMHAVGFAQVEPETTVTNIETKVTLIQSPINAGYAGGVNLGLTYLRQDKDVDLFWILNPDSVVDTNTASAFAKHAEKKPNFSLMGSRVLYLDGGQVIQSDGGNINMWTGVCNNRNQGLAPQNAQHPDASSLQFISGANMVASRQFIERVGLLNEDYFLYYEEVDWAMRRADLPLEWCTEALVFHHGGTAIGTGAHNRGASAFANYFNFRNRMMFISRFNKTALPIAYLYTLLKIIKVYFKDGKDQAIGGWRGLNFMAPPQKVADRIDSNAKALAFPKLGSSK